MSYGPTAQAEQGSKTGGRTADWLIATLCSTTSDYDEIKDLNWYLAGRSLYQHAGYSIPCQTLFRPESADPSKFSLTIYVGGENQNYLVQSFKNEWKLLVHNHGRVNKSQWHGFETNVAIGPTDDAWTVRTWIDVSKCEIPEESELSAIKSQLGSLLRDFKQGIPLDRPEALLKLAAKVAEQSQQPNEQSIESWAEELAQKLSKLSD
jgi:hypothetical protein